MLLISIGIFVFLGFAAYDAWAEYQGDQDKQRVKDNAPRLKRK